MNNVVDGVDFLGESLKRDTQKCRLVQAEFLLAQFKELNGRNSSTTKGLADCCPASTMAGTFVEANAENIASYRRRDLMGCSA